MRYAVKMILALEIGIPKSSEIPVKRNEATQLSAAEINPANPSKIKNKIIFL